MPRDAGQIEGPLLDPVRKRFRRARPCP